MRREVTAAASLLCALLAPVLAFAGTAECRIGERAVACEHVEQCVARGGIPRIREDMLKCCFADGRCTDAGSRSDRDRLDAGAPPYRKTKDHASGR
ncbi:hypothetical protein SVA_0522 [Sulfurifustis variabilis]|uniref:Uncharacterized protein n=1 Tax=Sulfurifustis variabilis TaxID=1675686 RepID=A0A1B4V169_9GAMM|nr:hypothetical protein [Sulfurifustis variabilis]BAU47103.1 hypothetical protein SVA_0522 [Sulfurifustis variabilis]